MCNLQTGAGFTELRQAVWKYYRVVRTNAKVLYNKADDAKLASTGTVNTKDFYTEKVMTASVTATKPVGSLPLFHDSLKLSLCSGQCSFI